jgi:hypothetical protein
LTKLGDGPQPPAERTMGAGLPVGAVAGLTVGVVAGAATVPAPGAATTPAPGPATTPPPGAAPSAPPGAGVEESVPAFELDAGSDAPPPPPPHEAARTTNVGRSRLIAFLNTKAC